MKIWKLHQNDVPADHDPFDWEPVGGSNDPAEPEHIFVLTARDLSAVGEVVPVHRVPTQVQEAVIALDGRDDRPDLQALAASSRTKLQGKRTVPKTVIFARLSERELVPKADAIVNAAVFPVGHLREGQAVRPYWDHYNDFKRDDPQVNNILADIVDGTPYTVADILADPA